MDLNEIPSDKIAIKGAKFDDKFGVDSLNSENYDREVARQKFREREETCLAIELEIRKKIVDLEGIKTRVRVFENEKVAIEKEIDGLRKKRANLEGIRVDEILGDGKLLSLEESKVDDELMIENNKVLECEKSYALSEVEIWKRKCQELESRVFELERKLGFRGVDRMPNGGDDNGHESRGFGSSACSPGVRNGKIQVEGTPCIGSPQKQYVPNEDDQTTKAQPGINVKRRLLFQNENNCNRKIAPSTPAGARSSSGVLINIVDSDDESDIPAKNGFDLESKGTPYTTPGAGSDGTCGSLDQADVSDCSGELPFHGTPKRKRDPKVFTSDDEHEVEEALPRKRNFKIYNSDNDGEGEDDDIRPIKQLFKSDDAVKESDNDDNIPISQLIKMKHGRVLNQPTGSCRRSYSCPQADNADSLTPRRRRRLVKSDQGEKKNRPQETENIPGNLAIENDEDDKEEEDGSYSDSGSLGSFIVDDDVEDVEDDGSEEEEDETGGSRAPEDSSDDNLDFKDIISRLERRKTSNSKWDLEGDMLSDFAKDPIQCMRAVCALYRQQTNAEKICKGSIVQNGRGFSRFDALRGTRLGEFLTGGDPNGDLVKSKEELREHDWYGHEECFRLAKHYSKQLFEIYKNGEDPFFS